MSYGQQLCGRFLRCLLPDVEWKEDFRPPWLHGMELDFFCEELNLAIEFNGCQHIAPTDFGGMPYDQMYRDRSKRRICKARGISFISLEAIDLIQHKLRSRFRKLVGRTRLSRIKNYDLDHEATTYRKTLIKQFDCPTARKKGKQPRKKALKKKWNATPQTLHASHSLGT